MGRTRSSSGLGAGARIDGVASGAAVLLGTVLLLVGCADRRAPEPQRTAVPAHTSTVQAPVSKAGTSVPVPRTKPAVPAQAAKAAVPKSLSAVGPATGDEVAIMLPPPSLDLDPGTLVGLSERETISLLGAPAWTEEIPPAKTWQYGNARCRLRVFLFMEMNTRDFRTLSYELTSTDGQTHVAHQCFAELVAAAWGP